MAARQSAVCASVGVLEWIFENFLHKKTHFLPRACMCVHMIGARARARENERGTIKRHVFGLKKHFLSVKTQILVLKPQILALRAQGRNG